MRSHRVTMTDFRLCSGCPPCSQACFCHCTHRLISDQPEQTFARLRYDLGGDHPSQTAHHALSPALVQERGLDTKTHQGGISPTALRVPGIFTENSISLSLCWRQCGDRYAIHAGRNLPDKEFRYLRTVRVTAAVYWGFTSMLAHLCLTFQHWAGVSPYTSSYTI